MNFGQALEAVKNGKLIRRAYWEKGHFVFMQVPSEVKAEIVPKMQSVPDAAKEVFAKRFEDPNEQIDSIHYVNQFAFVGWSSFISGWSPCPEDCLSEDWELFE